MPLTATIPSSVVSCTITSNGKTIPADYQLLYIDTTNEFNRIAYAELGLMDGDLATQTFPVSDSDYFEPGRELDIKLRYEGAPSSEKSVFKGIVVKQGLQVGLSGSVLVVEACHEAIKMTGTRGSAKFNDATDSDVMQKLLAKHGVKKGNIERTTVNHKQLVQYQATDWDFILSRAEANGLLLVLANNGVSAMTPTTKGSPKLKIKYGIDEVFGFEIEADARQQYTDVACRSWDAKNQSLTSPATAPQVKLSPGNLSPEKMGNVVGNKKETLLSAVALAEKEAKTWAEARMIKSRMAFIKGRISIQGTAQATTGDLVTLEGIGKRFSGDVLVSGVRHRLSEGNWITDLQFGLSIDPILGTPSAVDAKAAGLLPGVNGLQIGVVEGYADDPEKENRVRVILPALNAENKDPVWARLASLDAGNNRGINFWPELGDEVILGFLNDDPRQPVILGAVYSSANQPPLPPADQNPQKGIVTREGLQLVFDDENKSLSILTSENNSIIINDKEKTIVIKDANNNSIKMDDQGITIDSGKDVVITAQGNLKFQTDSGNVTIKGQKIDIS